MPKLTALRSIGGLRRLKPFEHNSWFLFIFNTSCFEDIIHLTFILFLLLHLFTTNGCAFDLKQLGKSGEKKRKLIS